MKATSCSTSLSDVALYNDARRPPTDLAGTQTCRRADTPVHIAASLPTQPPSMTAILCFRCHFAASVRVWSLVACVVLPMSCESHYSFLLCRAHERVCELGVAAAIAGTVTQQKRHVHQRTGRMRHNTTRENTRARARARASRRQAGDTGTETDHTKHTQVVVINIEQHRPSTRMLRRCVC